MTVPGPAVRIAVGRPRVVREIRAAAGLMADLAAPIPARGPWLTAVVNDLAVRPSGGRPVAVVVEDRHRDAPAALALLHLRRGGGGTTVRLLGADSPVLPGGRPASRLLARDDVRADALAAGLVAFLAARSGRWRLDLRGLPLGDPTAAALAARLPAAVLATERSTRLVDDLARAVRSHHARDLERALPDLLAAQPRARARAFLRAVARLHAALGQVEVARGPSGAVLLTLVDGTDRWPWWRTPSTAARTQMGAPLVRLTASGWAARGLSRAGAGR